MSRGRLLFAGLVAGAIINVPDGIVSGVLVADAWRETLAARGLEPTGAVIPFYVAANFVAGIVLAWLVDALSARFGRGAMAPAAAVVLMLLLTRLFGFGHVLTGEETLGIFLAMAAGHLVGFIAAAFAVQAIARSQPEIRLGPLS